MMKKTPRIEYTETFYQLASQLIDFQSEYLGEINAIEKIQKTIESFEELVKVNPLAPAISTVLLGLGIQSVREYKANGLSLFYQVFGDENVTIQCRIIVSQKQDIETVLVNHCIIYK
ncbi:hypothetical protein K6Y31_21665 [Motilimonas cestriensis]|uniref:Uncharacterized protein n=1 Tax=Motilimonas cestriensis TaxID=2742685 RepID=A0ABS8WE99_9GAMM|nr:hypothetical protein [Motilimonas cestriensis]MCE2597382.1 hypothetical protein [Motilimonas cestriensis]